MGRRRIHTQIEIDAPRLRVWQVLTDFSQYAEWNPWMTRIEGKLAPGARLDVKLLLGKRGMRIQPTVVQADDGHRFRWLGHMFVPGLFDGEHAFELEALTEDRTRFVHSERFRGVLAGLVLALIHTQTREGFVAMNEALKRRCETLPASPT